MIPETLSPDTQMPPQDCHTVLHQFIHLDLQGLRGRANRDLVFDTSHSAAFPAKARFCRRFMRALLPKSPTPHKLCPNSQVGLSDEDVLLHWRAMKVTKGALRRRLRKIRCLLLDVDGVLTDGKLHFTSNGEEFKTFDVQDGHGIAMAQRAGLTIGFISGRPSKATTRRAADLHVKIVLQKPSNKMDMVEKVKRQHGFTNDEIAFVGDELVDLPVLRRVGLAVAVPNATDEVKRVAHYMTKRRGGDGAVREVIEMILKARGIWGTAIAKYLAVLAALLTLASPWLLADSSTPEHKDPPGVARAISKNSRSRNATKTGT